MKKTHTLTPATFLVPLVVTLLILIPVLPTLADGPYTLEWWTVDGGGATFSGGDGYALGGTIGQPDAGVLGDGDYILAGGFWVGGGAGGHRIYLPLVLRNA